MVNMRTNDTREQKLFSSLGFLTRRKRAYTQHIVLEDGPNKSRRLTRCLTGHNLF